jgi:protein-disulfide isomerase
MTAAQTVTVEFFFAGGCEHCVKAREALREVAQSTPNAEWREIDVGKNPHRAVDVGVVGTPAVAINGDLVFKSAPTPAELRSAIEARSRKG